MIDDLRAITLFVKTVDAGSFRACARQFNLSPSVVSQQIRSLELKYGVTLLYRSTRKLTLSQEGQHFYDKAQSMVHSAHDALNTLSQTAEQPSGKINLTMPAGLIKSPLMKKVSDFCHTHPHIQLDLHFTDKRVDMIAEGVDLALRVGQMRDSSLKSRKLGEIGRKLVCAPSYLKTHPPAHHPKDLHAWDWIKMKMMPPKRILLDQSGQPYAIPFQAQIEVDNVDAMTELTRQGLGLSTPPDYLVHESLKDGSLVEILPDWSPEPLPLYAVWPESGLRRHLTGLLLKAIT